MIDQKTTDDQLRERAAAGDRNAQRELRYRKTVAAADFLQTNRDVNGPVIPKKEDDE